MVAGIGFGMESHRIACNVLVGAGSRNRGAHSGIIDGKSHRQGVGGRRNVSALEQGDIVNKQIVVIIVNVMESDIDALTGAVRSTVRIVQVPEAVS